MAKNGKFSHQFDGRVFAGVEYEPENEVQQHEKDAADINVMARKYGLRALRVDPLTVGGFFGDFTSPGLQDLQTALLRNREAGEMFMELPSDMRAHFDNDPMELLSAVNDPDRVEELQELGLLERPDPIVEPNPVPDPREPVQRGAEAPLGGVGGSPPTDAEGAAGASKGA